ncbi:hypothetical protein [Aestuariivita sp.]|jgi:hypothetical protein|uniref:hypothetical protein n=1 Tax=Aestuariivita sp. TaxID=1872407 RepID=UPI00216DD40A|nr:hypothetical protein [Aestuariivita sp.]MCE8005924.1 hypothetical protein [Aestuariivita sp.]
MKRSRAELAAQLMKAARGAGLPLGVAEDLYAAAGFLDPEDVARIAADLAQGGAELVALMHALDAVECGQGSSLTSSLAPALAAARGWRLEAGRKAEGAVPVLSHRIEIPDDRWAELDAHAARTYVPDTAASRAQGAGAGQIDND